MAKKINKVDSDLLLTRGVTRMGLAVELRIEKKSIKTEEYNKKQQSREINN